MTRVLTGSYGSAPVSQVYEQFTQKRREVISNHLVPGLLALFLFYPFAILGLIFSANVKSRLAKGDFDGARRASYLAKAWSYTALGIGGIWFLVFSLTFVFFYAAMMK